MEDLKVFTKGNPNAITKLALALEIAMVCDDAARARYLTIYGVEWSSLDSESAE